MGDFGEQALVDSQPPDSVPPPDRFQERQHDAEGYPDEASDSQAHRNRLAEERRANELEEGGTEGERGQEQAHRAGRKPCQATSQRPVPSAPSFVDRVDEPDQQGGRAERDPSARDILRGQQGRRQGRHEQQR